MNQQFLFEDVRQLLQQNNQPHEVLPLQEGVALIITQRGGRILGPFLPEERHPIFWLNPAWATAEKFSAFLESGDWNLGGERVWIAPEIQYNIRDRADFWGSYYLPPQMDPGHYTLAQPESGVVTLSQSLTLEAYNLAAGQKALTLHRQIHPAANPLHALSNVETLMAGVTFAGYDHEISLSDPYPDQIMSESWALIQLQPGGRLFVPTTTPLDYADYFEPIDGQYQQFHPNYAVLRITGDRRYKVGYKAAQLFGRLGYFNEISPKRAYLLVRNFYNDPSATYLEEPPDRPGQRGYSVHVYNDGGKFGGFGELECNGRSIGGQTGRSASTDVFTLWLYVGATEKIKNITTYMLGVQP